MRRAAAPVVYDAPVAQASVTGRIVGQAWPVLFGQFSAVAYSVVDTILTGHASPPDLAAMGAVPVFLATGVFLLAAGLISLKGGSE